jgi:hypothetical protein
MKSYSWKSHPARERPVAATVVTLFVLAVLDLVYNLSGNFIMVLVGVLIFLVTLSTFYFPTRYTVDEKNVTIKYVFSAKSRNLSAFRSVYPGLRGVLLSPFLAPSRLENFRGFYLRYGKNNKAEVDGFLRDLLGEQEETGVEESSRGDA